MDRETRDSLRRSYDEVTDEYVTRISDELCHKPLDRELLFRLVKLVGERGPICDLGCGPGHVARYLRERGADVCGIDLSPAMIAAAQKLNPDIPFSIGDMLDLDVKDASFGGVAAFYSLVNIPRPDLPRALREIHRVLRPGGFLLAAFHIGEDTVHLDDWWGKSVSLDFFFFQPAEIAAHMTAAGLRISETIERDPYPAVEHPSRRAYVFAERPR